MSYRSHRTYRSYKPKIVVAMSGGVDSSVAALLLKQQGFDVVGMMLKLWHAEGGGENRCCDVKGVNDARLVCDKLKTPFYLIDARKEFRKIVVENFLNEYRAGRTPNPCVICNREIKFNLLWQKARSLGADFLATGHYARVAGNSKLLRAKDKTKDQSYMLWQLKQEDLQHTIFPLGDLTKKEVREIARKNNLAVSEKKESQEICFVADNYHQFLRKYLPAKAMKRGKVIDMHGNAIAEHNGLPFYTEGQRVAISNPKIPDFVAHYVARKDLKNNALIVAPRNSKELLSKEMRVEKVNWLRRPGKNEKLAAQIRYHHPAVRVGEIREFGEFGSTKKVRIRFGAPQRAVTPGQSAVFYSGEEVVGGGVISGR